MSNERDRRRTRFVGRKTETSDDQYFSNDLAVHTEFKKRPNRALSVPEVAILLGGQGSFNIAASFERLTGSGAIYETKTERHVGKTIGDEITISSRYRLVMS